jgi:hypothetical protein
LGVEDSQRSEELKYISVVHLRGIGVIRS